MLVTVLLKLPEPLKKHEKRPRVAHPHSTAQDFLWFGLPHAGSAVAILRRTSHCGETARFLPLFFWRYTYTTPPCSRAYARTDVDQLSWLDPGSRLVTSPSW